MPTTTAQQDFLARWEQATLTGFHRLNIERCYPAFFTGRNKSRTFEIITAHHQRLVVAGDWSEQELADALHTLMSSDRNLSVANLLEQRAAQ